ncbi:MAG: Tn3 family transposase [Acidobacteriota bacterium]|nr:Tn3 family transposase [Acidobacteriota bacterium]
MRYVGVDRLPRNISDFDVGIYFKLSPDDVTEIHSRFRQDRRPRVDDRKVGLAAQLIFLRATGQTFDQVKAIPPAVLRHIGEALKIRPPSIVTLRAIYKRRQSLYDHQQWARDYLGLKVPASDDLAKLKETLKAQAAEVASADELVTGAKHWLYNNRLLIPGERAVRELAVGAFAHIEREAIRVVKTNVSADQLAACTKAVFSRHEETDSTVLQWLKRPPKRHSKSTLENTLAKVQYLKELGVHAWNLNKINLPRQHAYAQALACKPPSVTKRRSSDAQMLQIVCFLRVSLLEISDSLIYQANRRASDLVRHAKEKTAVQQARSSVEYRERLVEIKDHVKDKPRPLRERMDAIETIIDALGDLAPNSGAAIARKALIDDSARVHALLTSLNGIEFKSHGRDMALKQLTALRDFYTTGKSKLPPDADIAVSSIWREAVDDEDRSRAFKALEASAMMALSKSMRSGAVWVDHTFSFRERDQMLIPPDEWERDRERHLSNLGLPRTADEFLAPQLKLLEAGIQAVSEARSKGKLEIDQGELHLPPLEALDHGFDPKKIRDLLYKDIGNVQFPDLILEMDAQTNFSEVLLGRRAYDDQELISLYAALIAHGTEIDAKSVAAMIPGIEQSQVSVAMRALESHGRLERANQRVVEFTQQQGITKLWGDGKLASSDMMSLDASKHLWNARVDPRRRTFAAGIYSHVLDSYIMGYVQPIVLGTRQAGAAIEGAIRYNSFNKTSLLRLAVDTHGYTYPGVSVAKLLGFDVCVRLRDLSERKLYVPRKMETPDGLDGLVINEVSLVSIRKQWDNLCRFAASIQSGRVNANVAMRWLSSAAKGDPLRRAADQLGRLLRSIFLCDYFTLPDFRREMHKVLNRGESVHTLQRVVYYGKIPTERGRRRDEMFAISGSHGLLTNLVIAWNTRRLQETTDVWRKSKREINDEWLAHIGPANFSHINFRGTFRFGIERYRAALIVDRKTRRAV